jgi:myosin heavy subunit
LELKTTGILSMIDEELNIPRGSDETLLNKIFKTLSNQYVKRYIT